ncbi:hypothetical protein H1R20_g4498, partial [Candolleomyces eurysporus]
MPIYAVPKDNGTTYRMVTNHSAGPFSLNSMIDKAHVFPSPLDNMTHVGDRLIRFREAKPDSHLTMWKADVAEAYRLLPVHPHWQLKQVVTLNGVRHVDRRNTFGRRASGAIWIAFMALVTWIAQNVRLVENLIGAYVDDSFGFNEIDDVAFYCPYSKFLPRSQALLLELWDELGIPHKERKQVFGSPLTIIGFDVDPNNMSITLPDAAKKELLNEIETWIMKPKKGSNNEGKFKIARWQPFTESTQRCLGRKIHQHVWINNAIRYDLNHLRNLPGTHIMSNTSWDLSKADITIYVDACLEGMGFWYANQSVGYYSPVPASTPSCHIFYFEALCALSALIHATSHNPSASRIVIFSDSTNTVDMFSSLCADQTFNHLLLMASDIVLKNDVDLRVLHITGRDNVIADAISRLQISSVLDLIPNFYLQYFQPPRFPLGAVHN